MIEWERRARRLRMSLFWLLFLCGLSYWLLQRSVPKVSRTPVWQLWLVLMSPLAFWLLWSLLVSRAMPLPVFLLPLIFSAFAYWSLLNKGRIPIQELRQAAQAQPLPTAATASPEPLLTSSELDQLRHCFPFDCYQLQRFQTQGASVLCWGRLRGDSGQAYATVQQRVQAVFGDRLLVLLREAKPDQPLFVVVAAPERPRGRITRPLLALTLLVLTLLTTTSVGYLFTLPAKPDMTAIEANPNLVLQGLPYALALLGILGVHESGHYLAARRHRLQTTLPYFIPIPAFLGTFGAFIQIRSPMPNRRALFDVGLAGPLAGLAVTLPVLVAGLQRSSVVPLPPQASLLSFHHLDPHVSILMSVISHVALGGQLGADQALQLHPLAIAGYLGLIVTALNLIPVGQLDGGHVVHAMYGLRASIWIAQAARLLVLVLALLEPELLFWGLLLLFMPVADEPALDDVTEIDGGRALLGLVALLLLVLIILPMPEALGRWLYGL